MPNIVYFHPYLGRWSNLTNIFQMAWNLGVDVHMFPEWIIYHVKCSRMWRHPFLKICYFISHSQQGFWVTQPFPYDLGCNFTFTLPKKTLENTLCAAGSLESRSGIFPENTQNSVIPKIRMNRGKDTFEWMFWFDARCSAELIEFLGGAVGHDG